MATIFQLGNDFGCIVATANIRPSTRPLAGFLGRAALEQMKNMG